nr:hypothetical protein [Tolivirales sp.]
MVKATPMMPGRRRRRVSGPTSTGGSDAAIIRYHSIGTSMVTDSDGNGYIKRYYVPGNTNNLTNSVGPSLVSAYSVAKFLPGTKVRWEPSVTFNTSGRVFVGFTDNPEVVTAFDALPTVAAVVAAVKGLGDVLSFPVWQETDISFPTRLRRKLFDINQNTISSTDTLDRCMQIYMIAAVEGVDGVVSTGSFWFHDVVQASGIQPFAT